MRICMIAYTQYATDSRVRREAEALARRGDRVDVLCLGEGEGVSRPMEGIRALGILRRRYRGPNAILYLIGYGAFFALSAIWVTGLYFRKRYEIIQVHTMPDFMVFATTIAKLFGAKIILDVHDLMPELYQSKFGLPAGHWLLRLICWIERQSVRFADRAIAVHAEHLETLVRHGNAREKFITLMNLPDPTIFRKRRQAKRREPGKLMMLYHGTISRRQGLDVVLRALSSINRAERNASLRIVGEGDYISSLIRLADDLEVSEWVEFAGPVDLAKLPAIIQEADVGLVPVLEDDFTKIMLPVKLLEYVMLNVPVICSRTETIERYFDDSMVRFVEPGDVSGLAEAIVCLSEDPEAARRLSEKARCFNREHNWNRERHKYYRLVDELASTK
jgi:glycosyltransferase involved in cell wall biosynthesis